MKNKTLGAIVAGTFIALASPAVVSADELNGASEDDCETEKQHSDIYNNASPEAKFTNRIKVEKAKKKVRKRKRVRYGTNPVCGTPEFNEDKGDTKHACLTKKQARKLGINSRKGMNWKEYTDMASEACPGFQKCYATPKPQKELLVVNKETTKEVKVPVLAADPINAYKTVLEGMDREKCMTEYDTLASKVNELEALKGKKDKKSEGQRKLLSKVLDQYVKNKINMDECKKTEQKVIEITKTVEKTGPQGPAGPQGPQGLQGKNGVAKPGDTNVNVYTETKPTKVTKPVIKPTPEQESRIKVAGFVEVLSGAATETNTLTGLEVEYDSERFVAGARGGYLRTDVNHQEVTSEITSEKKLLPDGTTYKNTTEGTATTTTDSQDNGFVGGYVGVKITDWLKFTLGADARFRKQTTTTDKEKTTQLERNNQPLGSSKTITKQEASTKTNVGFYPNAGLEACQRIGNLEVCVGYEGGYDFGTDKQNHGGKIGIGYSW